MEVEHDVSLFDLFLARGDEPDDDDEDCPSCCTRCLQVAWWNDEEESWECGCGFFAACDECGWWPQWDPDEDSWHCVCGYHL